MDAKKPEEETNREEITMQRRDFISSVAITVLAMRSGVAWAQDGSALMIRTRIAARITIDGAAAGETLPNQFVRLVVAAGEHLVEIAAPEEQLAWSSVVRVPPGEQVILEPAMISTDPTVGIAGKWQDPRDKRTYRTVRIGKKEWLAENLAYSPVKHYPPADRADRIGAYGRLYPWEAVGAAVAGLSAARWRLPSKSDFATLLALYPAPADALIRGGKSGWNASPAGQRSVEGPSGFGKIAGYWSSTRGPEYNHGTRGKIRQQYALAIDVRRKTTKFELWWASLSLGAYYCNSIRLVREVE